MNPGLTAISKILYGERGWGEPLIKIAKSYHNSVASLYIWMRNVIIITTSSKDILKTRNYF